MGRQPGGPEIDAALQRLPAEEYGSLLPAVRQVVVENLHRGRASRFLRQGSKVTLEEYVEQVARTLKAEIERLERLSANDDEAWTELCQALQFRAYLGLLRLGIAHHEARERAQDFSQEACVAILSALYPGDVPHAAWTRRILRNLILQQIVRSPDLLDRPGLTVPLEPEDGGDEWLPVAPAQPHAFRDLIENRQAVRWAIEHLPSVAQREVLRRDLEGWTDEEIAAHSNRSVQSVYNLRHRALREIQVLLGARERAPRLREANHDSQSTGGTAGLDC